MNVATEPQLKRFMARVGQRDGALRLIPPRPGLPCSTATSRPHRFLPYLSWTEIDALPDRENTVIVLPCGAIEQHGPHLPCSVDSVISSGVMGKALETPAAPRCAPSRCRPSPTASRKSTCTSPAP